MYDVLLVIWVFVMLLCLLLIECCVELCWWLFGLCIGFGLLIKGLVMLLYVVFFWLLGLLWNDWV